MKEPVMAAQPAIHPSEEALRAFALGKLDDVTASVLMSHLDSCADCCKVVATLSGDDFLAQLRQAQGHSSTPAPAQALPKAAPAAKPLAGSSPIANLPPELAANQQYEILRELGRGGMGVVYLAKNKPMDRLEVLKVINTSLLDRPGAVERFLREIRSAAKLSHANVVTAYSVLQMGGFLAFAMEYIEGQDLASVIKAQGPLPVAYACYYVQQAALGLQHASEKGMVHRDIKPQNLILARDGRKHIVKVLDFGLAKVMREKSEDTGLTAEGAMLGTPDYIAPEQSLDAAKADIRADIYSLGCTLYYLLSGHPPFHAGSLGAILLAHQSQEARPLNLLRPEVPEELAAVVRKMMAKSPAKRYQTPLEVVQALAPFIKQGTTPKSAPELSSGTAEVKSAVKKTARVAPPPPPPVVETPKQPPAPADVWGALTDDSVASVAPSKSKVVRKPRAVTVRERQSKNKWLMGGLGAGVLLLALMGMWAGGCFKGKTLEEKATKDPEPITNSIGMKMVLVKPGTFRMGSPANEKGRYPDEDEHKVEITRPFYMGIHEVTQEQYEIVMGENPSSFSSTGGGKKDIQGLDTRQFPVERVSWEDAVKFCHQLSERPEEKSQGRKYRLPTEAEWEYSCRGGQFIKSPSPPFHFGNSLASTQANFDGKFPYGGAPDGPFLDRTQKVGSYPHNALGLYDLHGNVGEWCNDWYDEGYYKQSPRQNPEGPGTGELRVLRGGSWSRTGNDCRAAYRNNGAPGERKSVNGFRVVLTVGARN
jgi:serine/threonine protein kinase